MVKKAQFENSAKLAIQNVIQDGDTDIFPFPFENHSFLPNKMILLTHNRLQRKILKIILHVSRREMSIH